MPRMVGKCKCKNLGEQYAREADRRFLDMTVFAGK